MTDNEIYNDTTNEETIGDESESIEYNYIALAPNMVKGAYLSYDCGKELKFDILEHTELIPCSSGDVFKVTTEYGYGAPPVIFYASESGDFDCNGYQSISRHGKATGEIYTVPDGYDYVAFNHYIDGIKFSLSKRAAVSAEIAEILNYNFNNNSSNIYSNKSAIEVNTASIENNSASIEANAASIKANTTLIKANAFDIANHDIELKITDNEFAENVLRGKSLYATGDSIAKGDGNNSQSYVDMIIENNGMQSINNGSFKNANGGATLAKREANPDNSVLEFVSTDLSNTDTTYDYILLEGGINDLFLVNPPKRGNVTEQNQLEGFDTATTCGALEEICRIVRTNHPNSKVLFVLTHRKNDVVIYKDDDTIQYNSFTEGQRILWDKLISVLNKWNIPYIDLSAETYFSAWNKEIADKYFMYAPNQRQGDGTHPNELGYSKFYVPQITAKLKSL